MTAYDQDPLVALREGLDEVLFLHFRTSCEFLSRSYVNPEIGASNLCSNPKNAWEGGKPGGGYPNCDLKACPIYERLVAMIGPAQQCDEFLDRWEATTPR